MQTKDKLQHSKAMLCEVDALLKELETEDAADERIDRNKVPGIITALGEDGSVGVTFPATIVNGVVRTGRIAVGNDGPFVVTDILLVVKELSAAPTVRPVTDFQFKFVQQSNGRNLIASSHNDQEIFVSPAALMYGGIELIRLGPNFPYSLPSQMLLPKNDIVEVYVKPSVSTPSQGKTVFVSFLGFTVLE